MARYSPLHPFISKIEHPILGQWGFHAYEEKGIVPGLRSQSHPETPASQSTLNMNYLRISDGPSERSSSELSRVQDVNLREENKRTIQ
jgi:hypothetical protein